jgi:putative oxidoreductase
MAGFMRPYASHTYALLRIIAGLLFLSHGLQKVFGLFGGAPAEAPRLIVYGAGGIELVAGALIAVGLFTRWAAFIASGEMAVAYWMAHGTHAFHPLVNKGELAVLYCFIFLFIAAHGPGIASLDAGRGDR